MVGSPEAFTGSVIDVETIKKTNERYRCEQEFTKQLDTCVQGKNLNPALCLILDNAADLKTRKRAIDLLVEINDLACIDPIRNHKFLHTELEGMVNMAIKQLLAKNHKKECPFCMEIIKAQAKLCMHCGKEI
jgi:hypothetical protein